MSNIKLSDITGEDKYDIIASFMLGLDNDIDKTILKFIYQNQNIVNRDRLTNFMVTKELICSERRLDARLANLKKFDMIIEFEDYNTKFYAINKKWLKELKEKSDIKNY